MANEEVLGPRKTMFVLVIVVGCFAVLWPRILSPLVLGGGRDPLQPNQFDRDAGCCEVIFEPQVAVLEILNEVCTAAAQADGKLSPYAAAECRRAVNDTCGLDIAAFIKRTENVGKTTKVLLDTMKHSNSSCLKEHFGVPTFSLSIHPALNSWALPDSDIKQERPPLRGGPHPALRERGRAIPPGGPPPARPAPLPPHVRVRSSPSPLSVYFDLDIKELTSENNIEEPDCNHDVVDPYSSDDDEQDPNWIPDVKKRIRFTDPTNKRIKRKKTDKNIKRKKKVNIIMSDDEDEDDQPLATLKQLKNIKLQLQNHTELPLRNQDSQEINLFYEEDETPCEKLPHQNIRENNGETMERPSNIKERSPEEAPLQKIERPLDSQEKTAEETPAQNIEIPPSNEERLAEEATAQNIERPSDNEQRLAEEAPAQNIERPSDNEQRLAEEAPAQNIERPSDNEQRLAEEAPAQNIERPSDNEQRLAEEAPAQNIERPSDNEERLAEEVPAQNMDSFSKSRRDNRTARTLGQPYLGFKKVENKFEMCINKPARTLKERCHHSNMIYKSKNTFLCALITDEERELIHKSFWDLKTWQEKKGFVKGSAKRRGIRRRRKTSARSIKKTSGHDFTLCHIRVCKKFYLNTLCIGEDSVRRWTKEFDIVFENDDVDAVTGQVNLRRSTVCSVMRMKIKEWLDLLPKVPSHYCRASSKKLYVESTFRSLLHMYTIYKEWCDENNEKAASRMTFQKVLAQENVSIHHPRKDQCDTCCSYKTGNISKESYDEHIQKKNEAREAKREAITKASNSESDDVVVITVDVQSVLLTPKLLASAVYYKQKLQCHNFTVYNTKTKHVTIYFWHEADGNVTANEFTSCLVDYIKTLPEGTKKVIVISDGCGHQNRNRILSSALSDLSMEKGITIQQLYLEKGHTMMEVDSVHSTIEQYIKPPIYAPTDYITRMRQARPQQPYEIKSLHYDFFLNYEELDSNLKSIRPGKKKGDPVVVDIRALKYKEDGSILFKLRHTDSWTTLPQRRRIPRGGSILPKNLYTERIKITESKFKHLQELKSVIDEDYHPFYDSLNYIPGV